MKKTTNLRRHQIGVHFTLRVWGILSGAVVVFAILATLINVAGISDDRSIIFSFVVTTIVTLTLLFVAGYSLEESFPRQHLRSQGHLSLRQIIRRLGLTFAGAPLYDLIVDVMRIVGIAGIGAVVFFQHSTRQVVFDLVFWIALFFVVFHAFIYPFIRTESVWEKEYRYRKLLIANGINHLAKASIQGIDSSTLKDIESIALRAIKSFLEFAVLDKTRNHFHVNLIIEHPFDENKLICIQRTNPGRDKPVPTFYNKEDMPTSMKVIKERTPVYISHFIPSINVDADYEMVWQIPMDLGLDDQRATVGIVAIDSTKPHHLDLDDNRETLLFNLTPYFALIRFSLIQRYIYEIWDDVININSRLKHPHLVAVTAKNRESHKEYIDAVSRLDRNLDRESLDVAFQQTGTPTEQLKRLERIAAELSQATTSRKVFGTLFPYLENNNRRIHG